MDIDLFFIFCVIWNCFLFWLTKLKGFMLNFSLQKLINFSLWFSIFYLLPFYEQFLKIAQVPSTEIVVLFSSDFWQFYLFTVLCFFYGLYILNFTKYPLLRTEKTYLNNFPTSITLFYGVYVIVFLLSIKTESKSLSFFWHLGPTIDKKSLLVDRIPKGFALMVWVLGLLLTKKW